MKEKIFDLLFGYGIEILSTLFWAAIVAALVAIWVTYKLNTGETE